MLCLILFKGIYSTGMEVEGYFVSLDRNYPEVRLWAPKRRRSQ